MDNGCAIGKFFQELRQNGATFFLPPFYQLRFDLQTL